MKNTDKPKILYVDDEKINLQLFRYTFEKNFTIVLADSGYDGLEKIKTDTSISVVISDMKMPGLNGLEFIKMLKQIRADLPCLLLTGYENTAEIEQAIDSELIVANIIKPFKKQEVESCINTILGRA
jgi:CheY-like chemotaxis protein